MEEIDLMVDRYKWDRSTAARLQHSRGAMSRYRLVKKLENKLGGCAKRTIADYENVKHSSISIELLTAICDILGTTIEYIIYGENP